MKRCSSVAPERIVFAPESSVNPGGEVVEGSVIINGKEIFAPLFVHIDDDAIVGSNGATVICPVDDLYSFEDGELIPAGTLIVSGCVTLNGELKCAPPPFTIGEDDEAFATDNTMVDGDAEGEDVETRGFCTDWDKINIDWLNGVANWNIPDLEGAALIGISSGVSSLMIKLSSILGKATGS